MNDFSYIPEYDEAIGVLMGLLGFLLIFALIAAALAILMYVFQSIGVYSIAKRRGIKHAWLAWLPYGSSWILGSISDQYRYVTKGQVKNRRFILLVLAIVSTVISGIANNISSGMIETIIADFVQGYEPSMEEFLTMAGGTMGVFLLLSLVSAAVSIVAMVFEYMALYDLYVSCNPGNSVLFLVLSIIFSVTQPFFVFACRNKDMGMPPRRPEPQWQPAPIPAPQADPWENTPEE